MRRFLGNAISILKTLEFQRKSILSDADLQKKPPTTKIGGCCDNSEPVYYDYDTESTRLVGGRSEAKRLKSA